MSPCLPPASAPLPRARRRGALTCLLVLLLGATGPVLAQLRTVEGKDHPLVGRFEGSTLIGYAVKDFDEAVFTVGGKPRNDPPPADRELLEGRVTRLAYQRPGEKTALEIFRNYEATLRAAGLSVRYSCQDRAGDASCPSVRALSYQAFPKAGTLVENFGCFDNARYAVYRGEPGGRATTVALLVVDCPNKAVGTKTFVTVHEAARMATGQVKVPSAGEMAAALAQDGRVALYGILFDTGRAEVKAESTPTLEQIGALLKADPKLALVVTGYTDNVGEFEANVLLSRRRAEAVVAALVKSHGVAAARLTPFGAGMTGPRAPNADEAGRAQNRRVELTPR